MAFPVAVTLYSHGEHSAVIVRFKLCCAIAGVAEIANRPIAAAKATAILWNMNGSASRSMPATAGRVHVQNPAVLRSYAQRDVTVVGQESRACAHDYAPGSVNCTVTVISTGTAAPFSR